MELGTAEEVIGFASDFFNSEIKPFFESGAEIGKMRENFSAFYLILKSNASKIGYYHYGPSLLAVSEGIHNYYTSGSCVSTRNQFRMLEMLLNQTKMAVQTGNRK